MLIRNDLLAHHPLSEDRILALAEELGAESLPSEMVAAVRAIYADELQTRRAEAFELGAVMIGEPVLADLSTMYLASEEAIERLRGKVAALPVELAKLEADNAVKLGEVETLGRDIETRTETLRTKHESTTRFGKWMRSLGVSESFEDAKRSDPELRALEKQVRALELERMKISTTLIQRRTPRVEMDAKLERLAAAADKLYACLAVDPKESVRGALGIASVEARIERRERLRENLEEQAELLESLKGDAATLGESLDTLIAGLRGTVAKLAEMIAVESEALIAMTGELGMSGKLFGTDCGAVG
jgi:chromosome segregation ATPase